MAAIKPGNSSAYRANRGARLYALERGTARRRGHNRGQSGSAPQLAPRERAPPTSAPKPKESRNQLAPLKPHTHAHTARPSVKAAATDVVRGATR